jgi:hypothetical protein
VQFSLREIHEDRGLLVVAQDVFPFAVARLFWIVGVDGQTRGGHRHHVTRQALIALRGCVSVNLDDGANAQTVSLDSPSKVLVVEPDDWHTMQFGQDAILLVVASHKYDPADYIYEPYPPRASR